MPVVLTLICQGSTAALKRSCFPNNDPLDYASTPLRIIPEAGLDAFHSVWHAPQLAAKQTAETLGLNSIILPVLSELNYGKWSGLSTLTVMRREPEAFNAWLNGAPPPKGESLEDLLYRCGRGLAFISSFRGNCCAVVSQAIVRGIAINVMRAPPDAFKHLDILPYSVTQLSFDGRRWQLRQIGARHYIQPAN